MTTIESTAEQHPALDDVHPSSSGGSITLVIPPAAALVPARARQVGGLARVHPYWSGIASTPDLTTGASPNWGAGTVKSVVPASSVTFHRRSGSFQALSVKTGRTISGIGPHELAQSEELEADPFCVDFDLQGLNICWKDGPSYTPDYHAHNAVRGLVAGEIKAHASYFADPEYATIMTNAARTLSSVGIAFDKIDASALHENVVRRRNVRRAYGDRFTGFSPRQRDDVLAAIDRDGEVPLGRIHNILGNDPRVGQQIVHAFLCRRVLAYDLDLPVTPVTTVRAAPRASADYDIRAIRETEPA
ncbi:MAG: hypothetical protein K2Y20_13085 [Sphingomonas sp.]|nr:hypothetical protein [Sphingomonas sp.]